MASTKRNPDGWLSQTQAELYENTEYMTTPPVGLVLDMAQSTSASLKIRALDIGCGIGQVGLRFREHPRYKDAGLCNIDKDESMVKVMADKGFSVENVDILTMPYDNEYTHVFANFVFFLLSDPAEGLSRAVKALVPGGTLAFTTWAKSGPFLLLQQAFSLLPVPPLPGTAPTWNNDVYVREQLSHVPVEDIRVDKIAFKHNIEHRSFADLAWDMRPVVFMIVKRWPPELQKEYGWAVFSKIEEVLKQWAAEGRELESEVWVFVAKKAASP